MSSTETTSRRSGTSVSPVKARRLSARTGGVPHVWAFVGDTPGRMLIAFAPASKWRRTSVSSLSAAARISTWNNLRDKENAHADGIELLGPPLPVA